ncbi:Wilms tumor protein-like protein [Frankliniella fusca]|uniref:Wilms tumor protein-like protein n=1 Tax=Frankliniella fusca TaxID=407009 RepID=A0AAE1LIG3_9NEOP|nr:Wilms tumor protein-like protein [Frankliniella fusca]
MGDEDDSLDEEIFQPKKKKSEKANSSVSSTEAVNYKCKVCSRVFSLRKNLLRHTRESHNNGIPSFKCLKCSGTFKREDKLKIHSKSCGHDSAKNEKRAKCDYPNCNLKFYFKSDLIKHLKLHHKQNIADPVEKNFDSIEEFQTWKDVEEVRTFSYFSEQAGANKHDGRIYYYCQQDGSDKAHRKISSPARKTSRKVKIGQIKTNKVCIAVMKVKIDPVNKSVQVIYFPSHSHPLRPSDFKYHPPTHAANNNINNQIALGVDPQIIHRNLQPSSLKRNNRQNGVVYSRDAVISKSAIKQRWAKVKNKKRLHKDDATSVYLTAKLLKSEEYNPVVVYKPVGLNVEIGPKDIDCLPNHKELFMFGIQSKEQKELLIEGSKTILVVDDTHNCTQYENFKLLNGLVVNENRRGWPVFHLITNKTDENTLKFFFQAIKEKCEGRLVVNCVITDDAPALINSIEMGFEEKIKHLLCCWHVQETFRRNLRSLAPISLNNVMLDELLLLMYTRKEEEFHQLLQGFKIKYKDSVSSFITYFEAYEPRKQKWAKCFRNFPHGNIDTTGHLESFHNRLKTEYMKRKPNKRVDDLIQLLLLMEEDDYNTRNLEAILGYFESPEQLRSRHVNGLAMDDSCIRQETDSVWFVKSATCSKTEYMVFKIQDSCQTDHCFDKCKELACPSLCGHLYSCTCPDRCPVCKHVHKLHSFLSRGHVLVVREEEISEINCGDDLEFFTVNKSANDLPETPDISEEKCYLRLESNMVKLNEIVVSRSLSLYGVAALDASIDEAVRKALASMTLTEQTDVPTMPASRKIAPKEKLATQESQLLPFKRTKKRRKVPEKPTIQEREERKADLLAYLKERDLTEPTANSPPLDFTPSTQKCDFIVPPMVLGFVESPSTPHETAASLPQLPENFTPSFHEAAQLCETRFRFGHLKITLLHVKSLEINLSHEEEIACKSVDRIFRVGWLYCVVIDTFLNILASVNPKVFVVDTDVCLSILRGNKVSRLLGAQMPDKSIFILPANLTKDHWCLILIMCDQSTIWYYDPFQKPITPKIQTLISNMIGILKIVKPTIRSWKIDLVKLPVQSDGINCGAHICWIANQVVADDTEEFTPLSEPQEFRKFIYEVISCGCESVKN